MSALDARILYIECVVVKYFDYLISNVFTTIYRSVSFSASFYCNPWSVLNACVRMGSIAPPPLWTPGGQ